MLSGNAQTRPLLRAVVFFFLGIGWGFNNPEVVPLWFIASIMLFFVIAIFAGIIKARAVEIFLTVLLIILAGAVFGSFRRGIYDDNILLRNSFDSQGVEFIARLLDDCDIDKPDKSRLASIEICIINGMTFKSPGRVWLKLPGAMGLPYGTRVMGRGGLAPILQPRNPGDYDLRNYCRRENISAIMRCGKGEWRAVESDDKSIMGRIFLPIRRDIIGKIDEHIGGGEGEILKGLIIGARSGFSDEFKGQLRYSGLWHLLSLSGLHLGIIAGIILIAISIFNIPVRFRPPVVIFVLIFYCLLVETRAPIVRAAVIISLLSAGRMLHRYTDHWNLLALSAIVIVLFKPAELFSPGFHLTYAASAFIILGHNNWNEWLKSGFPLLYRNSWFRYIFILCTASFAASLGTAPFLAYHFGGIPLTSIPASVIGVPLVGILLAIFPVFYGFTLVNASMAEIFGGALWLGARGLKWLAGFSAENSLYINTPDFTQWHLLILVIPLTLFIFRKRQWLWAGLLAGNMFLWNSALGERGMRLTFLDVGQGNCALIELPGKSAILVDAGPKSGDYDAGKRIVVPHLEWRGIERIQHLILTHSDRDHCGGAEAILSRFSVEHLDIGPSGPEIEGNHQVNHLKSGSWLKTGGALLLFLNPADSIGDDNELSLAFMLDYCGKRILFTGDIPARGERNLLPAADLLESDILQVAHHGSKYSSTEEFLSVVSSRWAVISCGRGNFYGHPAPETLVRLESAGVDIHRTDKSGAACFLINRRGVEYVSWK
ncbi:MAG: DNA internalization-related competence protein ComEC/Rec2 [candidate division Zixibacteria bacterium]|nr:DNA internalization-related competence protein ComEC/Rec2 [Candidatus Tariuqbacter arcticus]